MPETGTEQQTSTTDTGATLDEASLKDPGKRALQAERDARKAAEDSAKSLQAQLDQFKQSQMSDLEKAQAQAKSFEDSLKAAQSEALRWRIAAKHGISDDDAETFLTGNDEASLTRQAERLAAVFTASAAASNTPGTPKPDLTQGGSSAPLALNSNGLDEALRAAVGA